MDKKEIERLENSCRMCRKIGADGEQLLLVKLDTIEELLRIFKISEHGGQDGRKTEDSGEKPDHCKGPEKR